MERWETVNDTTARLKEPGGWVYRIFNHNYGYGEKEMSCVFVPEVKA
jgi:hypothetical protein|nr:hypothetical protein [Neorhizobium tomejilense]